MTAAPKGKRMKRLDAVLLVAVSVAMLFAGAGALYGRHLDAGRQRQEAQRIAAERQRDQAQTECLNKFANQIADALDARTKAATPKEQATTRFFHAVDELLRNPKQNPDELRNSVRAYVDADSKLREDRLAHPYPDPPREVCPRG